MAARKDGPSNWEKKYWQYSRYKDDHISGSMSLEILKLWINNSGLTKKIREEILEKSYSNRARKLHVRQLNKKDILALLEEICRSIKIDPKELKETMSNALRPDKKDPREARMISRGLKEMYEKFRMQGNMSLRRMNDWIKASKLDISKNEVSIAHDRCFKNKEDDDKKYVPEENLVEYMDKLCKISGIEYEFIRRSLAVATPPVGENHAYALFRKIYGEELEEESIRRIGVSRAYSSSNLSQSSSSCSFKSDQSGSLSDLSH